MRFPVRSENDVRKPYPVSVPWELVIAHEAQAELNHSQSVAQLASRGGLSPVELYLVCHEKPLYEWSHTFESTVIAWLQGVEGVEWRT